MNDVRKALTDISNIRLQLAAGTMFRGFGPLVIGCTGGLAILTAAGQSILLGSPQDPVMFIGVWIVLACLCAAMIGLEMLARTRREHSGLADMMMVNAVEHFVPIGVAGAAVTAVLWLLAPDDMWLLPGLWQLFISLGLFGARRFLPPSVVIVAAWYLVAGIATLGLAAETRALSPWLMGLPFGAGQLLLAVLLHAGFEVGDE